MLNVFFFSFLCVSKLFFEIWNVPMSTVAISIDAAGKTHHIFREPKLPVDITYTSNSYHFESSQFWQSHLYTYCRFLCKGCKNFTLSMLIEQSLGWILHCSLPWAHTRSSRAAVLPKDYDRWYTLHKRDSKELQKLISNNHYSRCDFFCFRCFSSYSKIKGTQDWQIVVD